jgi:hypothetical protein
MGCCVVGNHLDDGTALRLATALVPAQREGLAAADSNPLFWSAFALFGEAPPWGPFHSWWRWLARWRHRRHAARYFLSPEGGPDGTRPGL